MLRELGLIKTVQGVFIMQYTYPCCSGVTNENTLRFFVFIRHDILLLKKKYKVCLHMYKLLIDFFRLFNNNLTDSLRGKTNRK